MATSPYKCLATGFESNVAAGEFDVLGGQATITGTSPLSGSRSLDLNNDFVNGNTQWTVAGYMDIGGTQTATCWSFHATFRLTALPSASDVLIFAVFGGLLKVATNTAGDLKISNSIGGYTDTGANLAAATTYELTGIYVPGDKIYYRLDGTDIYNVALDSGFLLAGTGNAFSGGLNKTPDNNMHVILDDLVLLWTSASGVTCPWLAPGTTVQNVFPGAEGNYAEGTETGVAHPNGHQNVDDYNNAADFSTITGTGTSQENTYKTNASITLSGSNVFIGFTETNLFTHTLAGTDPLSLTRDNSTDIVPQVSGVSDTYTKIGFWKYRPSDDTVDLTLAMLENTSGNNIEYGLRLPTSSSDVVTLKSVWVTVVEGPALVYPVTAKARTQAFMM